MLNIVPMEYIKIARIIDKENLSLLKKKKTMEISWYELFQELEQNKRKIKLREYID